MAAAFAIAWMKDLRALGPVLGIIFGGVVSAGAGYTARRMEDVRSRRASLYVDQLGAYAEKVDELRAVEAPTLARDVRRRALAISSRDRRRAERIVEASDRLRQADDESARVRMAGLANASDMVVRAQGMSQLHAVEAESTAARQALAADIRQYSDWLERRL